MLQASKDGVLLSLYVQPNGRKTEVLGEHSGSLKVRVHAPPVDGKANEEIEAFIAKLFAVPKGKVELLRGHQSRNKTIEIRGLTLDEAKRVLSAYSA